MSVKTIFNKYNRKRLEILENWKKLPNFQLVRPLTLEQQIERFQAAGRKLQELEGLGVYDFDSAQPIDDCLEDPTRDPDYDIIDAATTMRDLALKNQASSEAGTQAESQGNNETHKDESNSDSAKNSGAPPEAARNDPSPED